MMKRALKFCDGLPCLVVNNYAIKRVVGDAEAATFITINNMNGLNCVGQDGKAASFKKLHHHYFIRSSFDS